MRLEVIGGHVSFLVLPEKLLGKSLSEQGANGLFDVFGDVVSPSTLAILVLFLRVHKLFDFFDIIEDNILISEQLDREGILCLNLPDDHLLVALRTHLP